MGAVDILIELRRFRPSDEDDTHRVLTNYSRFDATPAKLVIEWTPDGYLIHQGLQVRDVVRADRQDHIAQIMLDAPDEGFSRAEISERWTDGDPPGDRTLRADLADGVKVDRWARTGAAKALRYHPVKT